MMQSSSLSSTSMYDEEERKKAIEESFSVSGPPLQDLSALFAKDNFAAAVVASRNANAVNLSVPLEPGTFVWGGKLGPLEQRLLLNHWLWLFGVYAQGALTSGVDQRLIVRYLMEKLWPAYQMAVRDCNQRIATTAKLSKDQRGPFFDAETLAVLVDPAATGKLAGLESQQFSFGGGGGAGVPLPDVDKVKKNFEAVDKALRAIAAKYEKSLVPGMDGSYTAESLKALVDKAAECSGVDKQVEFAKHLGATNATTTASVAADWKTMAERFGVTTAAEQTLSKVKKEIEAQLDAIDEMKKSFSVIGITAVDLKAVKFNLNELITAMDETAKKLRANFIEVATTKDVQKKVLDLITVFTAIAQNIGLSEADRRNFSSVQKRVIDIATAFTSIGQSLGLSEAERNNITTVKTKIEAFAAFKKKIRDFILGHSSELSRELTDTELAAYVASMAAIRLAYKEAYPESADEPQKIASDFAALLRKAKAFDQVTAELSAIQLGDDGPRLPLKPTAGEVVERARLLKNLWARHGEASTKATAGHEKCKKDVEDKAAEIANLKAELKAAQDAMKELRKECDKKEKAKADAEAHLLREQAARATAEADAAKQRELAESAKKERFDAEARHAAAMKEKEADVKRLEADLRSKTGELGEARGEASGCRLQVDDMRRSLTTEQDAVRRLTSELVEIARRGSVTEQAGAAALALREQASQAQSTALALQTQAAQAQTQTYTLQMENEALKQTNVTQSESLTICIQKLNQLITLNARLNKFMSPQQRQKTANSEWPFPNVTETGWHQQFDNAVSHTAACLDIGYRLAFFLHQIYEGTRTAKITDVPAVLDIADLDSKLVYMNDFYRANYYLTEADKELIPELQTQAKVLMDQLAVPAEVSLSYATPLAYVIKISSMLHQASSRFIKTVLADLENEDINKLLKEHVLPFSLNEGTEMRLEMETVLGMMYAEDKNDSSVIDAKVSTLRTLAKQLNLDPRFKGFRYAIPLEEIEEETYVASWWKDFVPSEPSRAPVVGIQPEVEAAQRTYDLLYNRISAVWKDLDTSDVSSVFIVSASATLRQIQQAVTTAIGNELRDFSEKQTLLRSALVAVNEKLQKLGQQLAQGADIKTTIEEYDNLSERIESRIQTVRSTVVVPDDEESAIQGNQTIYEQARNIAAFTNRLLKLRAILVNVLPTNYARLTRYVAWANVVVANKVIERDNGEYRAFVSAVFNRIVQPEVQDTQLSEYDMNVAAEITQEEANILRASAVSSAYWSRKHDEIAAAQRVLHKARGDASDANRSALIYTKRATEARQKWEALTQTPGATADAIAVARSTVDTTESKAAEARNAALLAERNIVAAKQRLDILTGKPSSTLSTGAAGPPAGSLSSAAAAAAAAGAAPSYQLTLAPPSTLAKGVQKLPGGPGAQKRRPTEQLSREALSHKGGQRHEERRGFGSELSSYDIDTDNEDSPLLFDDEIPESPLVFDDERPLRFADED